MLYPTLKFLAAVIMKILFRVEKHGTEHVPRTGPLLIVANHSSFLDPPLVGAMAPRQLTFLAKAELFRVPFLGWLIGRLGAYPVNREGADMTALRTAQRALAEGRAVLVFPEGTRGDEGELRPAKPGAALLAVQSGVPVVPVYVSGSGRAWPRGRRLPQPVKVVVTFGPPLRFQRAVGPQRKAQYETASREMMAAIGALKNRASGGVGMPGARRPLQIH
jgi:1-acyl-sn-glycerol-3-phosphate acyltransferase